MFLLVQMLESFSQKPTVTKKETTSAESKPDTAVVEIVPEKSKSEIGEVKDM